jgi:hypothetical protein
MPRRTRRGLGMVIWPFCDTMVFIPTWYGFLPTSSSSGEGRIDA